MSFPALAWASKVRVPRAADKLILLAYADRHNEETGCAYPSLKWLEGFSSLNRKTIITSVERLEDAGLLSDTAERMGVTKQIKVYRLHLETVPKAEPSQKRNSSENGAKQSQKRDTDTSLGTKASQKATPSSKPRARKTAVVEHELPQDWKPKPFGPETQCAKVVAGWPPGEEAVQLEHFRAHHEKNGTKFKVWQAAWKTWVLNSRNFGNRGNGQFRRDDGIGRTAAAARDVIANLERAGGSHARAVARIA